MKAIKATSFLMLMLLLLYQTADAYASGPNTEVELAIRVFPYLGKEKNLPNAQLTLDVNPGILSFPVDLTGDRYLFDQSIAVEREIENIVITLAPPGGYSGRVLPIQPQRTESGEKYFSRRLTIYTLQQDFEIPKFFQDTIETALLEKDTEKALALSEYANDRIKQPQKADGHKARVFHNYAVALKDACIDLGYDTCDLARDKFRIVLSWYESHPTLVVKNISKKKLVKAIEEIDTHNQKQSYAKGVYAYNRGVILGSTEGYGEAARIFDKFVETYPDNKALWANNHVTKEALYRDAGLSWLSYGIGLYKNPELADDEPLELSEIFETSQSYLKQALELGEQSPNAIEGLDLAQQWADRVSAQPRIE